MSLNNQFAYAVHVLTMLSLENAPMSSSQLAFGVNSHPVTIRKIVRELLRAGLVSTQHGSNGGTTLVRPTSAITLREVYEAVCKNSLLRVHAAVPDPGCQEGKNVQHALQEIFDASEAALLSYLEKITVSQVLQTVTA